MVIKNGIFALKTTCDYAMDVEDGRRLRYYFFIC